MHKLFLDDLREVRWVFGNWMDEDWVLVRSYSEFVAHVREHGIPYFISFDHDLGEDPDGTVHPSGADCVDFLIESVMSGNYTFPENFSFHVHSANPVGAQNIRERLNWFLSELRNPRPELAGIMPAMKKPDA
jgi:hypothetical protein